MKCSEFDQLIVSDDTAASIAVREHASGCPRCAEILAGQADLLQTVETWKESTPPPPPQLEQRILQAAARQAVARQTAAHRLAAQQAGQVGQEEMQEPARASLPEPERAGEPGRLIRFPRRYPYAWAALAATLILVSLLLVRTAPWTQAPQQATRLLVAEALKEAVRAEREHARAIARLEEAAAPILARSGDANLAASKAAVLIAYRDRLAHLDTTIAEIEGFLDNNPSHSGGRTVLLAAYTEKTQVLSQVIELEKEWAS